ncbi:hypothetical protein [Sphingomonas zeae]
MLMIILPDERVRDPSQRSNSISEATWKSAARKRLDFEDALSSQMA